MQPRNFGGRPQMGMFGPPGPQRGGGMFGPPRMPGPQGMDRGGILSRLFQRQAPLQAGRSAAGMFSRAPQASGGLLQGLTNPGNIQSFLNNTQHVLRTAQQIGPMVQQYGPLVRNLPAMWKLYKGFKDSPEEKTKESSSKPIIESGESEHESSIQESSPVKRGKSVPKLYI
ncbi:YqfQ protein [Bacillus freudenreichii]|nr:YqfQ protein [Bacillus freudenreichii]